MSGRRWAVIRCRAGVPRGPNVRRAPAGTACWMALADRPGCSVWNPGLQPRATVTWTAACADGVAALLDGCHHAALGRGEGGRDLRSEGVAVAAEHFRHGGRGARHGRRSVDGRVRSAVGRGSRSSGLAVEQTLVVATRR